MQAATAHIASNSPHSACTAYIEAVTAHTVSETYYMYAETVHIEAVISHTAPATDHIEAATAHAATVTYHTVPLNPF